MDHLEQIKALKEKALSELTTVDNAEKLAIWRVKYLGKKSRLTNMLRGLASLVPKERKEVGSHANELKESLSESLRQKEQTLFEAKLSSLAGERAIDITLPGRRLTPGRLHPITQVIYEICDIFV